MSLCTRWNILIAVVMLFRGANSGTFFPLNATETALGKYFCFSAPYGFVCKNGTGREESNWPEAASNYF